MDLACQICFFDFSRKQIKMTPRLQQDVLPLKYSTVRPYLIYFISYCPSFMELKAMYT